MHGYTSTFHGPLERLGGNYSWGSRIHLKSIMDKMRGCLDIKEGAEFGESSQEDKTFEAARKKETWGERWRLPLAPLCLHSSAELSPLALQDAREGHDTGVLARSS